MKEKIVKIELCKWEVGDLIGILNRHMELLQNELESTNDQSEEWMLRTQKRKTNHILKKAKQTYDNSFE